jgi:predicted metalloprotease with PDZ domain
MAHYSVTIAESYLNKYNAHLGEEHRAGLGLQLSPSEGKFLVLDVSQVGQCFAAGVRAGDLLDGINGKRPLQFSCYPC